MVQKNLVPTLQEELVLGLQRARAQLKQKQSSRIYSHIKNAIDEDLKHDIQVIDLILESDRKGKPLVPNQINLAKRLIEKSNKKGNYK